MMTEIKDRYRHEHGTDRDGDRYTNLFDLERQSGSRFQGELALLGAVQILQRNRSLEEARNAK